MKISVLGCGRWGTFIAWYLNKIGHDVLLWGRSSSNNFIRLKTERQNDFLSLNEQIILSDCLKDAVAHADLLIISINSQSLRSFMEKLSFFDLSQKPIVLCMKGIEESSGKRLTEVIEEFVTKKTPTAVWVGPGHVEDFTKGIPNCMVIDSDDETTKKRLVHEFSSDLIRFYFGADLIGTEVGAASKNVIGIAAGMLDGIGYASLKGALMSRGTREIARLIQAMGGNEISAYGLAHLGDYEATLFSKHSHNRKFGELWSKGEHFSQLAEGVRTSRALVKLGERYHVDLPICKAVDAVVNQQANPRKMLSDLFVRSIKNEF